MPDEDDPVVPALCGWAEAARRDAVAAWGTEVAAARAGPLVEEVTKRLVDRLIGRAAARAERSAARGDPALVEAVRHLFDL